MNRSCIAALFLCAWIPPVVSPALRVPQSGDHPQPRIFGGERYLYVWDYTIPGNAQETQDLLAFAAQRGIDAFFLNALPVANHFPGAQSNYESFVASAHGAGRLVFALGGNPWWATPCGSGIPGQDGCHDNGWAYYQSIYELILNGEVPFDGIIDDSEPYGTRQSAGTGCTNCDCNPEGSCQCDNYFWCNLPLSAQQYLDFLHGVRSRIGGVTLISAIPFWFDEDDRLYLALDGEVKRHPLNWYVSRIVDVAQLMDYRDVAVGQDGLIYHAEGELATGPTIIGVETMLPSLDIPPTTTFGGGGITEMEKQLFLLWQAYRKNPNYQGIAIHHYDSYLDMDP